MPASADFLDDPKSFLYRYTVALPGYTEDGGKVGELELLKSTLKPITNPNTSESDNNYEVSSTSGDTSLHRFKPKDTGFKIKADVHDCAWELDDAERKATLIIRGASSTKISGKDKSMGDWFPCLVLPWMQNRVSFMKIPRDSPADVFITGAMNGCSFVVTGDPAEPFVSHVNCDDKSKYKEKRRAVLDGSGVDTSNATHIGRKSYKFDEDKLNIHKSLVKTSHDLKKEKIVSQAGGDDITSDTLCFVMGVKTSGHWKFFYQRVITHQYKYIKRLGKFGGWRKHFGRDHREQKDNIIYRSILSYADLWPVGTGRLSM